MSGSRGEANFVWKCKNCKVFESCATHKLLDGSDPVPFPAGVVGNHQSPAGPLPAN
jgi:hypothetical protein